MEDKRPTVLILLVYQDGMLNSRQTTVMLVLVSWIISLVLAIPPLIGWGQYLPESAGIRQVHRRL